MTIEIFLHRINKRFTPNYRFAFFSTFFIGLFTHLFALTNHLLTWDSLYNFHDPQNTIHLGRAFLSLACGISSYYDLPAINGMLSLFYLSLTSICLIYVLNITKKTSIFFLSGIIACFPSVTSTLLYTYTADGYFLALLLSTAAIVITLKSKYGFIPASLLICFSYGMYQAYISYTITLVLIWGLTELIFNKTSVKNILLIYSRFLFMGLLGTALYLVSYKILLRIQHIVPSDYQGVSAFSIPGANDFLYAVKQAFVEFLYFFFGPLQTINLFKVLNIIIFIILFSFILHQIVAYAKLKSILRLLLLTASILLLPLSCCAIYLVSHSLNYHMLMFFSCSLIYVLLVVFYDKSTFSKSFCNNAVSWIIGIICALTIYNFALIANTTYLYAERNYERTYALMNRIADRIEQLEDYVSIDTLCVIGHFDSYDKTSINFPPNMTGIADTYLVSNQKHFTAMLNTYFNISLNDCPESTHTALVSNQKVKQMSIWPDSNSIVTFDNVVVLKIGN